MYYNQSFPFYTELMIRPGGKNGSFFFTLGGGPRYVYEKLEGFRRYSYSDKIDTITVIDDDWIPSFSFGIGRLIDVGSLFMSIEIRYSLGINQNKKRKSLPGDNTKFAHGFTLMQIQVLF